MIKYRVRVDYIGEFSDTVYYKVEQRWFLWIWYSIAESLTKERAYSIVDELNNFEEEINQL